MKLINILFILLGGCKESREDWNSETRDWKCCSSRGCITGPWRKRTWHISSSWWWRSW